QLNSFGTLGFSAETTRANGPPADRGVFLGHGARSAAASQRKFKQVQFRTIQALAERQSSVTYYWSCNFGVIPRHRFGSVIISTLPMCGLPKGLVLGTLMGANFVCAQTSPEGTEFFEKKIRPLLVSKCYSCHGEKTASSDLRLDSREG